jgi:hypothetical protein
MESQSLLFLCLLLFFSSVRGDSKHFLKSSFIQLTLKQDLAATTAAPATPATAPAATAPAATAPAATAPAATAPAATAPAATTPIVTATTPTATETNITQAFCFVNNNGTVYDLNPLYRKELDYQIKETTYTVDFNICKAAINQCTTTPNTTTHSYAMIRQTTGTTTECINLAGADTVVSDWTLIYDPILKQTSIEIQLPPGDVCRTDANRNYTTSYSIVCDPDAKTPVFDAVQNISPNTCDNVIKMRSANACPKFDVYGFWNEVIQNKYIVGAVLMILGAFFTFFGKKFLKVTEILTGVLLTCFLVMFLLFQYLHIQYTSLEFWLIVAFSVALGLLAGYFISKLEWLPPMILGGFLGYLGSTFLYQLCLKYIQSNPTAVYWVTLVACVILGAVLGYLLAKHVLIISTSFIGAYAFVRVKFYLIFLGCEFHSRRIPR